MIRLVSAAPVRIRNCAAATEMTFIRSMAPIHMTVHYPEPPAGQEELHRRVSEVHASAVVQRINALNCPTSQKMELLDAVIHTIKTRSREQT